MDRLRLISGGRPENTKKVDYEQIVCPVCEGSHFINTILVPMLHDNKIVGGTESMVCVYCLADGKITRAAF